MKQQTQTYIGIFILAAVLLATPVHATQAAPDDETSFFNLSKQERVQKVRETLRERREHLRRQATEETATQEAIEQQTMQIATAESQAVATTEAPAGILMRITQRYQVAYTKLATAQTRIETYLTTQDITDSDITTQYRAATETLTQADDAIAAMETMARENPDIVIAESDTLTESFKEQAIQAKDNLKGTQQTLLALIQLIKNK